MVNPSMKNPGSHDPAAAGDRHPVYVDTSLGTHILLDVSDSDTVTHFGKRFVYEHLKCFPAFGRIIIHAFKVERNGCFYHLSESMPVICAFEGCKEFRVLSVDASSSKGSSSKVQKGFEIQPKIDLADPEKAGIDANGIACATANEKINTSEVGVTNGSKKRKDPTKHQSREQGLHASPAFHDSGNIGMHGAEIGSEDRNTSNDKNKKTKLQSDHVISSQDVEHGQISKGTVKDFKDSTCDERPKEKSVAVNPNLSGMEDEICKGKIAIDEARKVVLLEKFNPSHQIDINGGTSLAELIDTNKGKESDKYSNGIKLKKPTKGSVLVQSDDYKLKNKTVEKTEISNEKDHIIMLSEEVGTELQIEKVAEVKELEQIGASVMVNDNLPNESFLSDHTVKAYGNEELQCEDNPDKHIKELGSVELNNTNKVRESVKSNTEKTKKKRSNKLVTLATMSEKNVNPCSDVSSHDHSSKSVEKRELPNDDEAMLSKRGNDPSRKEEESFLVSHAIEAPEENHKDSEKKKKKVIGTQIPSFVNLKEPSSIDSSAEDAGSKDEKMGRKLKESKVRNVKPKSMSKSISESHKRRQIKSVPEEAGWTDSTGLETMNPAPASLKKNTESSRSTVAESFGSKGKESRKKRIYEPS